jgi:hypothetical protein
VFAASLCYAKITPAALHCGEIAGRCREGAEAAGRNPKFGLSDFPRVKAGLAAAVVQARWVAPS